MRKDISVAQQIVQAGHACQESGGRYGCPEHCHLVLSAVKDEKELMKVAERLGINGIDHVLFFEPDDEMGYSALCTAPLVGEQRRAMRRYQIYK